MSKKKKIKDTKLGIWLKEKAPDILGIVGDLLPDSGALGVVKNLLDKDDSVDPEEAQRMIDAEVLFQGNVTERWKADMSGDVKLIEYIKKLNKALESENQLLKERLKVSETVVETLFSLAKETQP